MSSMRIGPYEQVGPAMDTMWGKYSSPHMIGAPTQLRHPWWPPEWRGRHVYRTQPRTLGPAGLLPADPAQFSALQHPRPMLSQPPYAHSSMGQDHQQETRWGMYTFLGLLGLATVAWLGLGAKGGR